MERRTRCTSIFDAPRNTAQMMITQIRKRQRPGTQQGVKQEVIQSRNFLLPVVVYDKGKGGKDLSDQLVP